MERYHYSGPVLEFDRCVQEKWTGETMAVSKSKARSNLTYQWKKEHGRTSNTKITLPGDITVGGR